MTLKIKIIIFLVLMVIAGTAAYFINPKRSSEAALPDPQIINDNSINSKDQRGYDTNFDQNEIGLPPSPPSLTPFPNKNIPETIINQP